MVYGAAYHSMTTGSAEAVADRAYQHGEFVRADKRQIQMTVLGGADSDEPLMLPMEAIELDAFRRVREDDTFWCGTLLSGCGGRLTTKLYADRACHFAHHLDTDGLPHVCGRRSRGVDSADHLYVRAAAAAWLVGRGERLNDVTTVHSLADGASAQVTATSPMGTGTLVRCSVFQSGL